MLLDRRAWDHHRKTKMRLINKIKARAREKWIGNDGDPRTIMALGVLLDQDVLTIGFARRFASYKRSTLIFRDAQRLKRIVTDAQRPVQIVFSGKAHPDDQQSKLLLQEVFNFARDRSFSGRIASIYDILEKEVVSLYYDVDDEGVPRGWVRPMKVAIRMTGPNFCAIRMVKEYMETFYRPALEPSIRPKNLIQERERT